MPGPMLGESRASRRANYLKLNSDKTQIVTLIGWEKQLEDMERITSPLIEDVYPLFVT